MDERAISSRHISLRRALAWLPHWTVALLLALPLGAALGWGAAWAVLTTHQTETFRVPVVVAPRTFAWAALVMLGAGVASALLVRRRLDRLDLVAVLKTRE
jgi:putative ABC transport system permease protein